ncbi:MAG: hypothetical protein JNL58_27890 [Planctomyces sp.]|nr:hypothetical protein [Planctomyces sp.]
MSESLNVSARQSFIAPSNGRLITFAILAMIGIGVLAWDYASADRNSLSLIRLLPGAQFVVLACLALVRKVPLRATIGAYTGGLLVIATVYYAIWYDSLNYNGGGANIGLGIMALAAILLLPIPMLIGGFVGWLIPTGKIVGSSETRAGTSGKATI